MDNETTSTEEFFSAFEDTGYQTGDEGAEEITTDPEEAEQTSENPTQQGEEAPESGESAGENTEGSDGKKPAEGKQQPDSFTLKVNKEERTVSREEMIALAQKGADYDRVKAAADKSKSDNEALNRQISEMKPLYDTLCEVAKGQNTSVENLLENFQIQILCQKENLSEGEARERLARVKAERELEKLKTAPAAKSPEQVRKERADQEIAQFQKDFPDVPLSEVPVDELMADVQSGKSLTIAYQGYLMRQKDAEIQRLNTELAAAEQNRRNRQASPGSAGDSGSRKTKSATDDFWAAFA